MKINDLSKQLGVTNGDLIKYLKDEGFKASSHLQNATDEMIDAATAHFANLAKPVAEPEQTQEPEPQPVKAEASAPVSTKKFDLDERIPCRSVTPWKLTALGVDRKTVYHWEGFGDVDYVAYRDLQAMRRKDIITKPKIIIEDPDICIQWRREIGDIYKPFTGVEYPEDLFDLTDTAFEDLVKTGTDTVREVIKVTAVNMIKNQNYPSVNKIAIIDKNMGTCIKEFL